MDERILEAARQGKLRAEYRWKMHCIVHADTKEILAQFGGKKALTEYLRVLC